MLALFKSHESRDFEKAMDFLECSRTLMGSAIETHRAIADTLDADVDDMLELSSVVRSADAFLKKNLEAISMKIRMWKLYMQLRQPERYSRIERIINNAEKNMQLAREKAVQISHWVQFESRPV
jgi:hypothetical protein